MNKFEGIKAGDKVLKHDRYGKIPQVDIVQEITKAGNLKVGGKIYTPDGYERTSDRFPSHHISPFSQEEINASTMMVENEKFSNEVLNRLGKLKSNYAHAYLDIEKAKILDAALKEIGY